MNYFAHQNRQPEKIKVDSSRQSQSKADTKTGVCENSLFSWLLLGPEDCGVWIRM